MIRLRNTMSEYLTFQVAKNFFAILIIISLIIFSNQFFLVLNRSLTEGYLSSELFPLMLLKFSRDLPFIISFSFSLALIYTLNRLYKNSELVILSNAGFGDFRILRLLIPIILVIMVLVTVSSVFISPEVNSRVATIKESAQSRPDFLFFKEGVFQQFNEGKTTFYSSDINEYDDNQLMKNVFIFSAEENMIIFSNIGKKVTDETSGKIFLELSNGKFYQNLNSRYNDTLSFTTFDKFEILLFDPSRDINFNDVFFSEKSLGLIELIYKNSVESYAEIIYRFSIPLSFLIMSILSIQFSRVNPRGSKNYVLGLGLVTYILYYNLLVYIRENMSSNYVDLITYFFFTHCIFLLLIFIIFVTRNNLFSRKVTF